MSDETRALRVVVNDERYISEKLLITALGALYRRKNEWMLPIAILCDDYLDPRGALLGHVRDEAIRLSKLDSARPGGPVPETQP